MSINIQHIISNFKMVQESSHLHYDNKADILHGYAEDYGMEEIVIQEIISYLSNSDFKKLMRINGYEFTNAEDYIEYAEDSRTWKDDLSMFTSFLNSEDAEEIMDVFDWDY